MAELDPLGEVYQGKGGTGAAYVIPGSHTDPADLFVQEMNRRSLQQKGTAAALAKVETLDKYNKTLFPHDTVAIQGMRNDVVNHIADLYSSGANPATNPQAFAMAEQYKDQALQTAIAMRAHYEAYDKLNQELLLHPEKYTDESRQNLETWKQLPFQQRINVDPNSLMKPVPDANWIKGIEQATKGQKFEAINENPVQSEVNDSKSLGWHSIKQTKFDEAAATAQVPDIISSMPKSVQTALHQHAVDALKQQGLDISDAKPDELIPQTADATHPQGYTTADLLRNMTTSMVVNHLRSTVKEGTENVYHPKPTGGQQTGDVTTGNDRFAWAGQDTIRLNTPQLAPGNVNENSIRTSLKIPSSVPLTDETIAAYGDKAKADPLYKSTGKNNTATQVNSAINLYSAGKQQPGTVIKTYPIQNLNPAENSPHDWTFTGNNGKETTVKGSIKSVDKVLNNATNKTEYVAEIVVPAHKEGKNDIPQHTVQAPYSELESQIETYTRGKKNIPGFSLRSLETDYTSPNKAPTTNQVQEVKSQSQYDALPKGATYIYNGKKKTKK